MPLPLDYESWPRPLLLKIVGEAGQLPDDQQRFFNKATAAGMVTPIGQVNPRAINAQMRSMSEEDVDALPDVTAQAYANVAMKADSGSSNKFNDWDGKMRYGAEFKGQALLKRYMHEIDPERYAAMFPNKVSEWEGLENDEAKLKHAWENMDKVQRDTKFAYKDVRQTTSFGIGPEFTPREASRNDLTSTPKQFDDLTAVDKKELLQIGKFDAIAQSFSPMRKHLKSRLQSSPGAWEFANKQLEKILQGGKIDVDSLSIFDQEQQRYIVDYIRHVRPRQGSEGWAGAFGDAGRSFLDGTVSPIVGGIVDLPGQASTNLYDLIIGSADDDGLTFKESYDQLNKLEQTAGIADSYKPQIREGLQGTLVKTSATLPFMAYVAASPVTFGLTGYLAGSGVANQTRNNLIADGVDPDIAGAAGVASGTLAVTVERFMGVAGKFGLSNAPSRRLMANIMTDHILKRAARKFVLTSAEEFTEELIEAVGNEFIQQAAYGDKRQLKTMWGNAWKDAKESGDVVLALSAFGLTGRGAAEMLAARISKNRSQESENQRSMDEMDVKRRQMIEDNPALVNQIVKEDLQNVSRAWSELKTDEEKTNFLRKSGVQPTELDKAEKIMDAAAAEIGLEDAAVAEAEASIPDDASVEFTEVTQEVVDSIKQEAAQYADEVVVQNDVLDADGVARQALYKDGKIIISSSIEGDANLIVREEIGHGLFPKLTQDELSFIKSIQDELVAQTGVDVNYADVDSVTQLEEAFAKKFAEYTPKQRTLVQKFIDWIKSILPINKDGKFENIDQVMQSVEARERGADTGKAEQAERASRFTKANVRALAQRIALGRLAEGRSINANQLRKMFPSEAFQEAGLAEDLINEAKEEIASMTNLEADALKRGAQLTEAARKREVRRARKEAGKIAREGFKAERIIQQARVAAKAREKAKSKKATDVAARKNQKEALGRKGINVADLIVQPTNGIKLGANEYFKQIEAQVATELEGEIGDFKDDNQKYLQDLRESLYHALYSLAKHMPRDSHYNATLKILRSIRETSDIEIMKDRFAAAFRNIKKSAVLSERSTLINDAKSILNSAEVKKKPGSKIKIEGRTIAPEYHRRLKRASDAASLTGPKRDAGVKLIDEFIGINKGSEDSYIDSDSSIRADLKELLPSLKDRAYEDSSDEDLATLALESIVNFGHIDGMDIAGLVNANNIINTELKTGKVAIEEIIQKRNERLVPLRQSYFDGVKGAMKGRKKISNTADKLQAGAMTSSSLFERMERFIRGSGNKAATEALKNIERLWSGSAKSKKGSLGKRQLLGEGQEFMANSIVDAYNIKGNDYVVDKGIKVRNPAKGLKVRNKARELSHITEEYSSTNPEGIPLAKQHLIQIIAMWAQPSERAKMEAADNPWTAEMIGEANKHMTSGDYKLLELMRDWYITDGSLLDKISQATIGVKVSSTEPQYMPSVYKNVRALWNPIEVSGTSALPPTLFDRKNHKNPVDLDWGVLDIFNSRLEEHSHYKAYAESIFDLKKVLKDSSSIANMKDKFGKVTVGDWMKHLSSATSNYNTGPQSKFFSGVMGTYSTKALGYNAKLIFTQPTSAFSFMWYMSGQDFAKNLAAWNLDDFKKVWNSKERQNRMAFGRTDDVANAMSSTVVDLIDFAFRKAPGKQVAAPLALKNIAATIEDFAKFGHIFGGMADLVPTLLVGPGLYATTKQNMINRGYEGDIDDQAMADMWVMTEKTQQSNLPENKSVLQRRAGYLGRALTMFKSFPQQIWASTESAIDQIRHGTKAEKKDGYRKLFINTVVLPATYYAGAKLFAEITGRAPENEEEETKYLHIAMAGLLDPLDGWVGPGVFIQTFLQSLAGESPSYNADRFIPAAGLVTDTGKLADLMNQSVKSWAFGDGEEFDKALESVIKSVPALRTIKDVKEAIED